MRLFKKDPEQEAARTRHQQLLAAFATADSTALPQLAAQLPASTAAAAFPIRKESDFRKSTFRRLADRILDDEILTEQEEAELITAADAFGYDQGHLNTAFGDLMKRLVLARANDGRLPVDSEPQLMAQGGEVVHGELPAALVKEVAVREFRGGSSGVSVRIAKGVRVHSGSVRGRSVVVGTQVQIVDTGLLSITSQRVVFMGSKKTVESKYAKLVGLQVYTDAVAIGVSNRQTTSVFRVEDGPYTAALINAAAQQTL